MELDSLKSAWKNIDVEIKNTEQLKQMLREHKHPVLKGIRLQLIIEMTAWIFFLFIYYNMFDGDRKPVYLNLLLVAAVLLLIIHSFTGYLSAKNIVKGNDLKRSLVNYLSKIRMYAILSVGSRMFTIACLLIFFSATITFTPEKKYLLSGCSLVIIVLQAYFLSSIWSKRIKKLNIIINELGQ